MNTTGILTHAKQELQNYCNRDCYKFNANNQLKSHSCASSLRLD